MSAKPYKDPDLEKDPEQLFNERNKRLQNAMQLKQPDRIPIQLNMSYMLAEMYGATHQEQHENAEKEQKMLEKAALYFQPDSIFGLFLNPGPSLALGDQMTKFPGYNMSPNGSHQFVEGEYMKAEDYDAFLDDPSDWCIRKYWPKVFSEMEGLSLLPPLGMAGLGTYCLPNLGMLKAPPLAKALKALSEAIEASARDNERMIKSAQRMASLGFAPPTLAGSAISAPFDFMSDTLRGMKGIMLDLFRCPEKLLAAEEKVLRFQLEYAVNWSRATGINVTFIPLHRGSDGFMSLKQFEKFYWPQYKALIIGLTEAGIRPFVFYEGKWDERLKYLAELPKGKTVGWFQSSDIIKLKEILGDVMCIAGGMKNSLLQAGTEEQVRQYTIELCKTLGKEGGFIMTTCVGEMEGCKPELVKVWVDTTKEFGIYA
ncbi:MAG: hypothetical protein JXN64_13775 [Spirochaetes bacterium]|nr:hypothetical protein [Spirochaetota bacterium]